MNDYRFGNFVCQLREQKNMTQAELASILGVTPAAVSKWENGSSKPRVEVLFQLAHILGVRPEELMAGELIPRDSLDAEAIKQINNRYEFLQKVDSCNTTSAKLRRLLAWLIDWNLIGLTVLLLVSTCAAILHESLSDGSPAATLIMGGIMLLYPMCFILRDVIFGGRSLGKRMLGLVVLDKLTGKPAGMGKCAVRNLFLFILQVDLIVMLITGRTIGDHVAHTVVIRKCDNNVSLPAENAQQVNTYKAPKQADTKKTVFLILGALILVIILFLGMIQLILSAQKDNEESQLAYRYLISSEEFHTLGADPSKIRMNQYSLRSSLSASGEPVKDVEIGFLVQGRSFRVICHYENDAWYVCEECTHFS